MDSLIGRFRRDVLDRYVELVRARYRFHPDFSRAEEQWKRQLSPEALVNGPYLEGSKNYKVGESLADLPLDPRTRRTTEQRLQSRPLWSHQSRAMRAIIDGRSTVVATGTSSGKTICYQIPILDDLVRDPSPGLRAIIIYPLNALVNDQLGEWEKILKDHADIKFARFTGQTPAGQREYIKALSDAFRCAPDYAGENQQSVERQIEARVQEEIGRFPNRLGHREAIRATPPQILITNFSMLEYLLERPVDAPIFENARLRFLVLDEAHSYRGIQATEIAYLVRRLKDRLQPDRLACIATSATLGNHEDPENARKVRKFASDLFGEPVGEPSPITGEEAQPELIEPSEEISPDEYISIAAGIASGGETEGPPQSPELSATGDRLRRDRNLFTLRATILSKPKLLQAAAKELWPRESEENATAGLSAMLEVLAGTAGDLLPTRLHYFVKAQEGLHICLNPDCPGREGGKPAFFVSRQGERHVPEGLCPECFNKAEDFPSHLVEVVGCRRCGYLFGALQDLGPRYAQDPEHQAPPEPEFDTFSTELGWSAQSFWSYLSVDGDLPFPNQVDLVDDDSGGESASDVADLLRRPAEVEWCVRCGKRHGGSGDTCHCEEPCIRILKIFHRQCPVGIKAKDGENINQPEKTLLKQCPNCGTRRGAGLEPLQRFQESEDAMGTAMAIPLSHFETKIGTQTPASPKLLCFTDNRQRAAAFPSILEEETFAHEFSRRMFKIISNSPTAVGMTELGRLLAEEADGDTQLFFLPASREMEGDDQRSIRNLWMSEVFGYFTLPDPKRESIEDLGLVEVEYQLIPQESLAAAEVFGRFGLGAEDASAALQTLLAIMRRRKAISLPRGVDPDAVVFGEVSGKVSYSLMPSGKKWGHSWVPAKDRSNAVVNYLGQLASADQKSAIDLAKKLWNIIEPRLIKSGDSFVLDHELLLLRLARCRYACASCGTVVAHSALGLCPRLGCVGRLETRPFDAASNLIARWVSDTEKPMFRELRAEEHTAQIKKDLAKIIEDKFRKDEGVNLISSTTTFEMGINIGSLQKVLLRNAPPSSANYVQRVGRAGRGTDKNAICVTMCRRSKYDSDMWDEPQRLMAGAVRTPTVFLDNKIISQRHFNAVAFAKFLREEAPRTHQSKEMGQIIPIEAFLSPDVRKRTPAGYLNPDLRADVSLNFQEWRGGSDLSAIFNSEICRDDFEKRLGLSSAASNARDKYKSAVGEAEEELSAMLSAREKSSADGLDSQYADIGQGIKNLLGTDVINFLADSGFLPRYAFPLDVVRLETDLTRWSKESDVELSRSRAIAISEYAPGAEVIARKTIFTSAGLYVVGDRDTPQRRWYSVCPDCWQVRTSSRQEDLVGKPCEVCSRQIMRQHIRPYVEPKAFSTRVAKESRRRPRRYRAETSIRPRQGVVHFIDQIADSQFDNIGVFSLALKERGRLFQYNPGPVGRGFALCHKCGFSEPMHGRRQKHHQRLRDTGGLGECDGSPWTDIAYGHEFESFCLIIRPNKPSSSSESLACALQKGLCKMLDIESQEIGVSIRKREDGLEEIILYDLTPGGAGFVRDARNDFAQVSRDAVNICEACSCTRSCYDCLKDYGNQKWHERLNRKSVLEFLGP